jgi:hypothetical protein
VVRDEEPSKADPSAVDRVPSENPLYSREVAVLGWMRKGQSVRSSSKYVYNKKSISKRMFLVAS